MIRIIFLSILFVLGSSCFAQPTALVFQSDFGLKDGAVSAMKGVAYGVSKDISIFDVTHEIPAYNIWEAAYRLNQTAPYWPTGTVFVSVVDPGVGSSRKSIVVKTKSGHFFVTPDNGTITLIAETLGIDEVREINEVQNRLKNSNASYTFHGRDVYAYTGARLASGTIKFEEVGESLKHAIVKIPYQKPLLKEGIILGTIDVLDVQYGNIWTNIDRQLFEKLNIQYGQKVRVNIFFNNILVREDEIVYGKTFADVPSGKSIAYLNSLLNFSLAINMGNYAEQYRVGSGPNWTIKLAKVN